VLKISLAVTHENDVSLITNCF